jgi:hypothetical protein
MLNRKFCTELLKEFDEEQLKFIAEMLLGAKNLLSTKTDSNLNYSLKLGDYKEDSAPKKSEDFECADKLEVISNRDYTKTLNMKLDIG